MPGFIIYRKEVSVRVLINQFVAPTFCLCLTFTDINFRGMLHHVCDVVYDKNMSGPIRTRNWLVNYTLGQATLIFELF